MRLSVECRIDGIATLNETVIVTRGDAEYAFIRSEDGRLAAARIVRPLVKSEKVRNLFQRGANNNIRGLEGGTEGETYDDIIEEFKQLESMLAYSVAIQRLDWQAPTVGLIPESPEEAARIEFNHYRRSFQSPAKPKCASAGELKTIVENMEVFEPLTVVQAFWREARNEMDQIRYIPAFINYFYVLEAMYANGQFGQKVVLREFEKSEELRTSGTSFLESPTMQLSPHRENLLRHLSCWQKQWDVHGLLHLLVETRGEVHHYVPTKRRRYGTL